MNIYPNPSNNIIHVETPQNATIEIINIQGQLLKKNSVTEKISEIDISMLQIGLYLLKATIDNKIIVKRFVKM